MKRLMKQAALAMAALALLNGCAATPSKYARPSGVNPANDCRLFPVTQYMWRDAYPGLLDAEVQPEWFYPAYAGIGTLAWVVVTPFLPVVDALVLPLWAGQDCTWENTAKDIQKISG